MVILDKGGIQPGGLKIPVIIGFKEKTPLVVVDLWFDQEKAGNGQGAKTKKTHGPTSPHRPGGNTPGIPRRSPAPASPCSPGTSGLCGQSLRQTGSPAASQARCRFLPGQSRSGNHGLSGPGQKRSGPR